MNKQTRKIKGGEKHLCLKLAYETLSSAEKELFRTAIEVSRVTVWKVNNGQVALKVKYVEGAKAFFKSLGYRFELEDLCSKMTKQEFKALQAARYDESAIEPFSVDDWKKAASQPDVIEEKKN